jgi:NodT family efflux transporter outer membrane factor (OMF) lipoprotein
MKNLCPLLLCLLAGCAIGPDYSKPQIETLAAYKESGDWVLAQPKDTLPKGKWWEAFNDPLLNGLMDQVQVSNQTLRAAEARYTQARAAVAAARAGLFPLISGSAGASRSNRGGSVLGSGNSNSYSAGLDARWEIDLWGRIRRLVEASRAGAEASAADLENARLSLQAGLATNYFLLRVTDVQRELLDDTVKAFQTSLDIANNRYRAGVAAKVDVVQAESQVRSTQAQAIDLRATRAQLEHAIAVLIGKPPSDFTLEPVKFEVRIPDIPPGLPSTLLERRPDIAAAERRTAAANARIGAAQAAYFPALTLSGSGGFASSTLSTLFSAPSRVWSLGAGLADTILDFGARGAQVDISRAAYDETVANYRELAGSRGQPGRGALARRGRQGTAGCNAARARERRAHAQPVQGRHGGLPQRLAGTGCATERGTHDGHAARPAPRIHRGVDPRPRRRVVSV